MRRLCGDRRSSRAGGLRRRAPRPARSALHRARARSSASPAAARGPQISELRAAAPPTTADLQDVGFAVSRAADHLGGGAPTPHALGLPDRRRAARHGTSGVQAELVNRVEAVARRMTGRSRGDRAGDRRRRGARMRLRLYHHPDGTRVAYREEGTGPAIALLHSAMLSHKEFEPVVEHLSRPLPRRAARPAAARRQRGPPAPPVHAGWFADVMAGFCHEVCGAAPARRRPRRSAPRSCCARRSTRRARARAARADADRTCTARPSAGARARGVARRRAAAARARASTALLSHGARAVFRPERGRRLTRARRARGARPRAPRVRRRRRQREPRALVGRVRAPLAARARGATCSTATATSTCRCCCCGPTRTACTRCSAPRRRSTCCPTGSCACSPGTGYLIAYDDPVGRRA